MVISHVTIIADSALCFNAILGAILGNGAIFYIKNRVIHGCLEIFFRSLRSLMRYISWSTCTRNKFHISDHYSLHNKTSRRRDIRQAEYLAKRAHTEQTLSSFLVVHRCRRPDTARIRFRICIDLINHY